MRSLHKISHWVFCIADRDLAPYEFVNWIFSEKNNQVRMAMVNREAKRDVTVSKDALLKSYSKRLKDDVRSLADNFSAIVKTCRFSGMKTIK